MGVQNFIGEHPVDVLSQITAWQRADDACALIIVTKIEGGGVRARGALMAVSENRSIGYLSGGCIDADAVFQAHEALQDGSPRALRYGAGSPFVDLPLPCGGAIEVLIIPNPDIAVMRDAASALQNRRAVDVFVFADGLISLHSDKMPGAEVAHVFHYEPKLTFRIAGRGTDALAFAKLANAGGYDTRLQLVDDDDVDAADALGFAQIEKLDTPSALPAVSDDPWTAFVLLFHQRDWEIPLLKQALAGEAFYVGAVGSRRTHANRCDALRDDGISETDIARIKGPIGLVPALRDASMVAVSALAEIIQAFQERSSSRRLETAFLLLAAGASKRFENGDKLLATLDGKPVLAHAAALREVLKPSASLATVQPRQIERRQALEQLGWTSLVVADAHAGQSMSLRAGISALAANSAIDQVLILLADMPRVPASHIDALLAAATDPAVDAVMTKIEGVLCPPAIFKRRHFDALLRLEGDAGAKSVFRHLSNTKTIALSPELAIDIDHVADLQRAKETEHA